MKNLTTLKNAAKQKLNNVKETAAKTAATVKETAAKTATTVKETATTKASQAKVTAAIIADNVAYNASKTAATVKETASTLKVKLNDFGNNTLDSVDAVSDYLKSHPNTKAIAQALWNTAVGTAQIAVIFLIIFLVLEFGPAVLLLLV